MKTKDFISIITFKLRNEKGELVSSIVQSAIFRLSKKL